MFFVLCSSFLEPFSPNGHSTGIFNFAENDWLAYLFAVQGDPLTDITLLRQVKFVMKGGVWSWTPSTLN